MKNKEENINEEIWVNAHKNSRFYEVSNLGNIRNKKTKKILKPQKDKYGYLSIWLHKEKKRYLVNRLIYFSFNDSKYDISHIHHKNGNRSDNRLDNLVEESGRYHLKMHSNINRRRIPIDEFILDLNKIKEELNHSYSHIYNIVVDKYNISEEDEVAIEGIGILIDIGVQSIINKVEKNYGYKYVF